MQLRLASITQSAIVPALMLLPARMYSKPAKLMMLAIGYQESKFATRCQVLNGGRRGAGRGYPMFEPNGIRGVMNHPKTAQLVYALCHERDCECDLQAIYARVETDDILAFGLARLLLWTDAKPLPAVDDEHGAWDLYLRTWNPGKPRPKDWPESHALARAEVLS